jgi:hypothetical protein
MCFSKVSTFDKIDESRNLFENDLRTGAKLFNLMFRITYAMVNG